MSIPAPGVQTTAHGIPRATRQKERIRQRLRKLLGRSLTRLEEKIDTLEPRELLQLAEFAGKYGVGTQQERDVTRREVRYVVRLPSRPVPAALPAGPVAVLDAHQVRAALPPGPADQESDGTPGESA